jgi:RNase P/RNase MRP subunit POP5
MANEKKKPQLIAKKQKVLLPTLKEQQRYIVYQVMSKSALGDFKSVHDYILSESNKYLGIFDGAKAGLIGVKFNANTKKGVIRVNNNYTDKLKVCLGLIHGSSSAGSVDINVDCILVSGMLNKAESKMNV